MNELKEITVLGRSYKIHNALDTAEPFLEYIGIPFGATFCNDDLASMFYEGFKLFGIEIEMSDLNGIKFLFCTETEGLTFYLPNKYIK